MHLTMSGGHEKKELLESEAALQDPETTPLNLTVDPFTPSKNAQIELEERDRGISVNTPAEKIMPLEEKNNNDGRIAVKDRVKNRLLTKPEYINQNPNASLVTNKDYKND